MENIAYREMYENEMTHPWYIITRSLLVDGLEKYLPKNSTILDAGCGTGGTINFLKKRGFKNIYGIDISDEAIRYCRKRGLKNTRKGSLNRLPYKNNAFDAVICMDVLYQKGVDRKKVLDEFSRVLKRKGIVYNQEPAYNWLKSTHDLVIGTENRFTKEEIRLLFQRNFKVLDIFYFNSFFLPFLIIKRVLNRFFNKKKEKSDVQKLPFFLNKLILQILFLEKNLLNLVRFPYGLSIITLAKKNVVRQQKLS